MPGEQGERSIRRELSFKQRMGLRRQTEAPAQIDNAGEPAAGFETGEVANEQKGPSPERFQRMQPLGRGEDGRVAGGKERGRLEGDGEPAKV